MLPTTLSPKLEKALIILFFVLISAGLIWQVYILSRSVPFHDWDEAIYAQVAKEWVKSPSLTLHYNGLAWFEKPPLPTLYYGLAWLLPISQELTARLLSTFLSIGTLLLLYALSRKYLGNSIISLLAVLICIQSSLFIDRSILVNVDMMLTFGWLLYLWGMSRNSLSIRLLGSLIGILSKSLLGFIPLIVELFLEIIFRKLSVHKTLHYVSTLILGSLWYAVMYLLHGKQFMVTHFYDHLISRVMRPIELHFGGRMFYVEKMWNEVGPLMLLAGIGMTLIFISVMRNRNKEYITKLTLILIPCAYLVLLTFSKAKLNWYITPLIPFVGMGTVYLFQTLLQTRGEIFRKAIRICVGIIFLYCSYRFIRSVATIPPGWYIPTEKTRIARCISPHLLVSDPHRGVVYLVPPQQRKDAHVIEAANLQIGSSFIYGSAPAFIYYVGRPVILYYSPSNLLNDWQNGKTDSSTTLVVHEDDLKNPQVAQMVSRWNTSVRSAPMCTAGSLRAFIRDY